MIKNFGYIKRDSNYDEIANSGGRNIIQLSPIGFQWEYKNEKKKFLFLNYGVVCPLFDGNGFAIVDVNSENFGEACIIDINGFKIKNINYKNNKENYYDVYFSDGELIFIFNINNYDYKLIYDYKKNELIDCKLITY